MGPRRLGALCAFAALAACVLAENGASAAETRQPVVAPEATRLVVGGSPASAEGWPFAVALKLRKSGVFCGGTLIAPTEVVTAAHCVKRVKQRKLLIATGSPWLSGPRAAPRLPVARIRIHPDYNGKKVFHDIAVVTLAAPTPATPVQLPTAEEARNATRPGATVRVAGWGSRSAWGVRRAQRLKSARQRVFRSRKCQRTYKKGGFLGRSMICALGGRVHRLRRGSVHATDCFGDSGGPLVGSTPTGPRLVGVVSAGTFPCGLGGPSIYTRVSESLTFIEAAAQSPEVSE